MCGGALGPDGTTGVCGKSQQGKHLDVLWVTSCRSLLENIDYKPLTQLAIVRRDDLMGKGEIMKAIKKSKRR